MKPLKVLLALPLTLLMVSCSSEEQKIRKTCALWFGDQIEAPELEQKLGLDPDTDGNDIIQFCEFYK